MPTLQSLVDFFSRERPGWMRSGSALNMPERFNPDSRMISFIAHEHALRGGQNGVDTDHLLLAFTEDLRVRPMLETAGVDIDRLRTTIRSRQTVDSVSYARDGVLPRSSLLHLAWQRALDRADEECALHVTPSHLLIGTVRALRQVTDDVLVDRHRKPAAHTEMLGVLGSSLGSD